jgi:hypothetical protein
VILATPQRQREQRPACVVASRRNSHVSMLRRMHSLMGSHGKVVHLRELCADFAGSAADKPRVATRRRVSHGRAQVKRCVIADRARFFVSRPTRRSFQ